MKTKKSQLAIDLEGETYEEQWVNLVNLVSSACEGKNLTKENDWPTFFSKSDVGTIRVIDLPFTARDEGKPL